ncbi:GTP 3',8-cyclase MoaA [Limnobacter humi]|uniref:GTP 3',8-cyclase n=1 Tax=Limnobacter humi TaxID=1778671 RepID=A0ABT1WEF7_9BURK|nr:GTP 3',8-cyclase MoaA [Limnobacter humi]MCQ8895902.1 GTP 3',8-cyclase MoaA [Limnobacter humi]
MTDRVIHLVQEDARVIPLNTATPTHPSNQPLDALGRRLHDLRISVTDRCNFRCVYCMPKSIFDKDYAFLPHKDLLSFEEIERIAHEFVALGVEKIRLTGGEPLLRKNLEILVEQLARLRTPSGKPVELTLTTNGTLLPKKVRALKEAGLSRVTVSLDAIDDAVFKRMNDVDFSVQEVLDGIDAAHAAGLGPIKVNMVVKGGMNDEQIIPMARHFKSTPHILRFIEYMDVGSSNGWKMDEVVPSARVINQIAQALGPLQAVNPNYTGEVAERWQYVDGQGEIGVISSVTQAFCKDCSRIRLSTEGKLYTCLFATKGHDLKPLVRSGLHGDAVAQQLRHAIQNLWSLRADRYSEVRTANTTQPRDRIEMSYIGG